MQQGCKPQWVSIWLVDAKKIKPALMVQGKKLYLCTGFSGCSAARLARVVRDDEVGGSNPLTPTT